MLHKRLSWRLILHTEDALRENSPTNSAVEEDSHTHAIGIKSDSGRTRPPRERFQELVENAATYQLHSSLDPRDPKPFPAPEHYLSLSDCTPRVGHIYRIWKEDDIVVHLTTVVLILAKGRSWQVCKITRCSQNDRSGATFYEEHSKLSEEESTDTRTESTSRNRASSRLEPVTVSMNEKQGLEPDTWVNLEESFHMGRPDDYQVIYCGKLTTKSREYAVKKHKELYIG